MNLAIDIVFFFVLPIVWPVGVSVLCFRMTKRFIWGFLLSLSIVMAPMLVLALRAYDGFTEPAFDLMRKGLCWNPIPIFLVGVVGAIRTRAVTDQTYCRVCDYNLTGNVSGVCPECGTPIEARSEASNG